MLSYSHCIVTMAPSCIISETKRDIGQKSRCFHTHYIRCPLLWGPRWSVAILFGVEKVEERGYPTVKKYDDTFSCFDKILACDRQTDRHLATAQFALCIASRGKKYTAAVSNTNRHNCHNLVHIIYSIACSDVISVSVIQIGDLHPFSAFCNYFTLTRP